MRSIGVTFVIRVFLHWGAPSRNVRDKYKVVTMKRGQCRGPEHSRSMRPVALQWSREKGVQNSFF
jgi:hypothetical protein